MIVKPYGLSESVLNSWLPRGAVITACVTLAPALWNQELKRTPQTFEINIVYSRRNCASRRIRRPKATTIKALSINKLNRESELDKEINHHRRGNCDIVDALCWHDGIRNTTTTTTSVRTRHPTSINRQRLFIEHQYAASRFNGAASTTNYKYVDLLITSTPPGQSSAIKMYPTNNLPFRLTRVLQSHFTPSFRLYDAILPRKDADYFLSQGCSGHGHKRTATGSSPLTLAEKHCQCGYLTAPARYDSVAFCLSCYDSDALGFVGTGYHPHIQLVLAEIAATLPNA